MAGRVQQTMFCCRMYPRRSKAGKELPRRKVVPCRRIKELPRLWGYVVKLAQSGALSRQRGAQDFRRYDMGWSLEWGPQYAKLFSKDPITPAYNAEAVNSWRLKRGLCSADEYLEQLRQLDD